MFERIPFRAAATLVGAGALGVALTTAVEVVTAPYSSAVSLYAANGVVHVLKVVALIAFAAGMLSIREHEQDRLGRLGSAAVLSAALASIVGAIPYSLVEASLNPGLTPAAANLRLDAIYADQAWIGITASVAMPVMVVSVIVLAVVMLRRHLVATWAPVASLVSIPVAIAAMPLAELTGVPLPHPPAWIFLGLSCYGAALASTRETLTHSAAPIV